VDTQQTSIVFMGRDSFRMQIVGAEATPEPTWASKTQRIIERRKNDQERRAGDRRRSTDAPALAEWPELPAPSPMRRTIILISFVTFVSGAAVATAMDHLRRRVMPNRTAQAERVQAVAVPPAPPAIAQPSAALPVAAQPVAAPPAPTAPIVEPLPPPEPAFLQPRTAPEATADAESVPEPQKRPAVAKAMPVPRGALTPALRPRRVSPAAALTTTTATPVAPRALNVDPFSEPPAKAVAAKPAARSQWVDPFAE
jgi:hypothetical protein